MGHEELLLRLRGRRSWLLSSPSRGPDNGAGGAWPNPAANKAAAKDNERRDGGLDGRSTVELRYQASVSPGPCDLYDQTKKV